MPDSLREGDPTQVGTYRLHGRIGSGGMGRVYLGHSRGGHTVAVKVVRPELADDAHFRRRFAAEVAAARTVGGIFAAQVVDADPGGDPPWLATAYIPGPSLHAAVAEHGPLPPASVAALGAGLAEGLAAVHGCGVVHRDLKPANVLLADDGPRLIDFGIARAMDATSYTQTSTVLGTAAFMSPEQAAGSAVGYPGDVFSLGCVLAFAATGRSPFGEGPGHAVAYRVVHADPDLTGLPAPFADLVADCLAKDPAARPAPEQVLERLAGSAVPGNGHAQGRWLPDAVTEVITMYKTRVSTLVTPPVRPAAPDRPATKSTPGRVVARPIPRPGEKKGRWLRAGLALLVAATAVLMLYAGHPPFASWADRWLIGGTANLELRDCAAEIDGSLTEVSCGDPEAEYGVFAEHHWNSDAPRPGDERATCAEVDGWDPETGRAVQAWNHIACLEELP
ncbi:serine/threonine protein kinase [Murinocardiopsis flavida]|uniref:Serine/threonine protein kinase n=1 Tax=Murinocardiopsis flavida TaxID=645275 RepID=A0A2P8DUX8_9ACTN|nr:serine/threonine-protein kinase [Murinocardiopsis flavida]PSL01028.1 serine/threonine protein kinase [Murinocardiopsis flavida]